MKQIFQVILVLAIGFLLGIAGGYVAFSQPKTVQIPVGSFVVKNVAIGEYSFTLSSLTPPSINTSAVYIELHVPNSNLTVGDNTFVTPPFHTLAVGDYLIAGGLSPGDRLVVELRNKSNGAIIASAGIDVT